MLWVHYIPCAWSGVWGKHQIFHKLHYQVTLLDKFIEKPLKMNQWKVPCIFHCISWNTARECPKETLLSLGYEKAQKTGNLWNTYERVQHLTNGIPWMKLMTWNRTFEKAMKIVMLQAPQPSLWKCHEKESKQYEKAMKTIPHDRDMKKLQRPLPKEVKKIITQQLGVSLGLLHHF